MAAKACLADAAASYALNSWEEYDAKFEGTFTRRFHHRFFPVTHAQAQSAGSESNEIIVTANKREENLNKVGLTITAITADALTERKVSSVEDIANTVPGLSFFRPARPIRPS
ncbi:hypothetical protein ACFSTD_17170 [Novosphingobium colocasiae]